LMKKTLHQWQVADAPRTAPSVISLHDFTTESG
jgi:hypothetical protein